MTGVIDRFVGKYGFLSNFYPCKVRYLGQDYTSVEHAFQAAKTTNSSDRETIRKCITAKEAKRLGRHIKLREDWESVKLAHMEMFVQEKFKNTKLRDWLLETGDDELVEGNFWGDTFWGRCDGVGENHLGRIIMNVRDKIRNESENS